MLTYDMREICEATGIDYIIIEDTGKYWPLQDLKIGLIACSQSLFDKLNDIHTDLLLNVSPFVLNMLKEFIRIELRLERRPVVEVIAGNRIVLRKALESRGLKPYNRNSTVSVELIDTSTLNVDSTSICEVLKAGGVITLPGKQFFWTGNELGQRYLRVALARAPEFFENSVRRMMEVLDKNFER
jgi:DNA-binding transcriptional MocR family regulator